MAGVICAVTKFMASGEKYYPNLVIGFGKGGKTLAAYLAKHGQDVALIEKSEKIYGGTCINIACIPTKSLIASAGNGVPYRQAIEEKGGLTSFLRKKNYDNLNSLPGVTIVTGEARFIAGHEVAVTPPDGGRELRIRADRIFINTGTVPRVPDIPGIDSSRRVFTSTTLMEQKELPDRLIIIGGGFIGLEFAGMYAKFGAHVTILDHGKIFLPRVDREIAEEIFKAMTADGIEFAHGVSVESVRDNAHEVVVTCKDANGQSVEISGSALLVATGRKPDMEGLHLRDAGIRLDRNGFIDVDDQLKTNVDNVWAIGDINGGPQFTYISLDDFRIIRDQLFGGPYQSTTKRKLVASSVFITPPYAHIGLSEEEAVAGRRRIKVARLPAAAISRARILNNTRGLLKSVVDAETNRILGCSLFCVEASEMINTIQVAMNAGLDYRVVRDTIFTHPSMNEAFNDLYASLAD